MIQPGLFPNDDVPVDCQTCSFNSMGYRCIRMGPWRPLAFETARSMMGLDRLGRCLKWQHYHVDQGEGE